MGLHGPRTELLASPSRKTQERGEGHANKSSHFLTLSEPFTFEGSLY